MAFILSSAVPWGRNMEQYRLIFPVIVMIWYHHKLIKIYKVK